MKICVAQARPVKGDIHANIDNHQKLLALTVSKGADTIIFPELSLTGYEPELAKELATDQNDSRLDIFQEISDTKNIIIGVGLPTKSEPGVQISMIIFQPHQSRQTYSKQYLHSDEDPYFVNGQHQVILQKDENKIAPAICYELSVPEHADNVFKMGANIYIASAVKDAAGVDKAVKRLSEIARKYSMTVLFSNCVGETGGYTCTGNSAIWNDKGVLLAQLDSENEGILIIDTDTQEISRELQHFDG
ncbi:MAG: Nitrilase/cyanide hydratase and apolipoprotein N-acyltransferase [Chitinophagaceae bacterium]|nr:Nitrilase/cyanide hydratase and apolipoprotein N-acyltransferase [Chitinophagaceae bacterium]